VGTNFPGTIVTNNGVVFTNANLQVVHCARVDLSEPGVQFFATPRAPNYIAESQETLSLSISNFIKTYGVQWRRTPISSARLIQLLKERLARLPGC